MAAELVGGAEVYRVAAICELDAIEEVLDKLQAPRFGRPNAVPVRQGPKWATR